MKTTSVSSSELYIRKQADGVRAEVFRAGWRERVNLDEEVVIRFALMSQMLL